MDGILKETKALLEALLKFDQHCKTNVFLFQQNPPPAATPTPPPAVTATPPPQPRASSLPPENPPPAAVQNVPSQQNVGSPAAQPRRIERQLSNSTTSSLDDILSSSPDVGQISTASKGSCLQL